MKPLALRTRLTVFYTAVFGLLLTALALVSYRVLARQTPGAAVGRAARLVTPERHRPMVRQQHYRQVGAGKRHGIPFPPLLRSALFVRTAASARPGPGAKAARSRSDSPPQTPYRSPYWIA